MMQKAHQKGFNIKVKTAKQTFFAFCRQPSDEFSFALLVSENALIHAADTAEMWVRFLIQKLAVYEYS